MRVVFFVVACLAPMSLLVPPGRSADTVPTPKTAASPSARPQTLDASAQRAVLDRYCVVCHNAKLKTGNLELDKLDLVHLGDHAETGEKVVRKLRAGMMPPAGMPRPDPATMNGLITWMEKELDRSAATYLPAPGLHRLNRTEYNNAIRDVLGLQVDATKFL
ncbi:MAG: DUF1587 domain-containing protein, partial [Acidobacteriia bacterium]|nr:DUF1587 domain-containing protein [Terriglobia bacterium]